MELSKSDKLRIKVFKQLKIEEEPININLLKNKIRAVNYESTKRACFFLKVLGFINIEEIRVNKQKFTLVSIKKSN